jgi:tetratricopeptide (TPR) repeat protein
LGNLARLRGNFEAASSAFRDAVDTLQSIGSSRDLGPMMSLALAHLETGNMGEARNLLEAGCRRCRKTNKNQMLGCALACLLPCYASSRNWSAWDAAIKESSALLEETGMLSIDVAGPVQQAAEIALEEGEPDRARKAFEMALRQWVGLGRDEDVATVMKAIEQLVDH